jgi:plastocyanin
MEHYFKHLRIVFLFSMVAVLAGCPIFNPPKEEARVTTLLSLDTDKAGPVDEDEIDSLVVTITEITLETANGSSDDDPETTVVAIRDNFFDPALVTIEEGDSVQWVATTDTLHTVSSGLDEDDPDAGEAFDFTFDEEGLTGTVEFEEIAFNTGSGQTRLVLTDDEGNEDTVNNPPFDVEDGEAVFPYFCKFHDEMGMVGEVRVVPESNSGDPVVLFSGAVDVDLMQLDELSEVLSSVVVPEGDYTKIRLAISNPRLTLTADPGNVHTNVQLTANGRLFVSESFEVVDGEDQFLVLVFQGLHLIEKGNGDFVLTPQLRADVETTGADVSATGAITGLDLANNSFVLELPEGDLTVTYDDDTQIFLATDEVNPTGTEDNLLDATIQVDGTLTVNGELAADTIFLLVL